MSIPVQLKMPVYHHHSPSGEFSLLFPQLILYSQEQGYGERKQQRHEQKNRYRLLPSSRDKQSNLDKMIAQLHSLTTAKTRHEHTSVGKRCPLETSSPQQ